MNRNPSERVLSPRVRVHPLANVDIIHMPEPEFMRRLHESRSLPEWDEDSPYVVADGPESVMGFRHRDQGEGERMIRRYSQPFPRKAHAATFTVRVLRVVGPAQLTVSVHGRDEHESVWTTQQCFSALTMPCVAMFRVDGLKQLLRYGYDDCLGAETERLDFVIEEPTWDHDAEPPETDEQTGDRWSAPE